MTNSSANKKIFPAGQDGFTIIEVMISIMLLTIGMLGMAVMQTTAIQGNSKASTMTIASNIAASQIETIRSTSFLSLPAVGSDVTTNDPASGYPVQVQIAAGAVSNSRQITVTISRPGTVGDVQFNYVAVPDEFLQAP